MLENHTLHSGTYLYNPYMAVPPPPQGLRYSSKGSTPQESSNIKQILWNGTRAITFETARSRSPSDVSVVLAVVFARYSQARFHTTATGKSFGRVDLSFSSLSPSGGVSVFSGVSCPGGCRWMGSHFHGWIDYNGVALSLESLEFGIWGIRKFR